MYCRYISGAIKIFSFFKGPQKCWYRLFIFYSFKTYTNTFENVDIGLLNFIHSRYIPTLSRPFIFIHPRPILALSRLYSHFRKSYPSTSKNVETGSKKRRDLSQCFWKALIQVRQPYSNIQTAVVWSTRKKKHQDRNFDPIPTLFGAIPVVFKTLG